MSATDILLLPSIANEDFPNVISEGLGLGRVVIASGIAGVPEQISQLVNGIVSKPRSSMDIARWIKYCYENPEKMKSMRENAVRTFAEKFESEIAAQKYLALYAQMLKRNSINRYSR